MPTPPTTPPSDNAVPADLLARCEALILEADAFAKNVQPDAALSCYEKIARLCEDNPAHEIREIALRAAIYNANINDQLHRRVEAIAVLERALAQSTLAQPTSSALDTLRAHATCNLATLLVNNRESTATLARLNALVSAHHADTAPGMRLQICRARVHVFSIITNTRGDAEARPLGEQVLEIYQHDTDPEIRTRVANVLVSLATTAPTSDQKLLCANRALDRIEHWHASVPSTSTPSSPSPTPTPFSSNAEHIARLLRLKASAQRHLGDPREAIATLDTLRARFAATPAAQETEIQIILARAQADKAFCLSDLGRTAEELALYAEIAAACDEKNPVAELREAGACVRKLISYEQGNDLAARTQTVEDLLARFGADPDGSTRAHAAVALYSLAVTTRENNDYTTAISLADRYLALYKNDRETEIRATLGSALLNKGTWLLEGLKRAEDALAAYDEILARFPLRLAEQSSECRDLLAKTLGSRLTCLNTLATEGKPADFGPQSPPLSIPEREAIRALVNDGKKLCESKTEDDHARDRDHARGLANFDQVITAHRASAHPELRRQCARAFLNKGYFLNQYKRYDDALFVFDELHARYAEDLSMHLQELVALGLSNKTFSLEKLNRPDEQLPIYDEILRRYSYSNTCELRLRTATALFDKAHTLMTLNRADEALATYQRLIRRTDSEPAVQLQIAKAILNTTAHHGKSGSHAARIPLYQLLLKRFGATTDKLLLERVMVARECLAAAPADTGDTHTATEQTKKLLADFSATLTAAQRERMQKRLREWNPGIRDRVLDFINGLLPWGKTGG